MTHLTEAEFDRRPQRSGVKLRAPGRLRARESVEREASYGSAGLVRAGVLLLAICLLGVLAMGAIVDFQGRVDEARHAQVVIEQMRNEQGALIGIAFSPATRASGGTEGSNTAVVGMNEAKRRLDSSVATLARLGHSTAPAQIEVLVRRYYPFVTRLSALVAAGKGPEAALAYGASQRPGGLDFEFGAELNRANKAYDGNARSSRRLASVGTVGSIAFLLMAFGMTFAYSVRARRRSHLDATSDALTGLGNRRKLFADLDRIVASAHEDTISIGIFDLDRFKVYNDTFGHPAGDALLARLGSRLALAVSGRGHAYRIGGDEFVVIASNDNADVLHDAQDALTDNGDGFSIGCSFGTTALDSRMTPEAALHVADQRLYANKRTAHGNVNDSTRSETKDALLQVLTEQDTTLATHLGHVARLAASTAIVLELSDEQLENTRLAAELHDVGKAAIPASLLNKTGPLTPAERSFIERHSEIGERIVAAAPSLEAIAPIVRSAHERTDGTGYPDRLAADEIPISSRIIAVVDAYDAMTSDRPYRDAISPTEALAELWRCANTQFDAQVVEAFATAHARAAAAGRTPDMARTSG